ncbi:DUF4397 domain-containing protein [Priestia megaterium]|nr:DUF4397 domain-containing protein [Priestia megaterium]
MKRLFAIVLAIMLLALSRSLVFAAETPAPAPNADKKSEDAEVRMIHASPDAPSVDVFMNDEAVSEGANFKDVTDFISVQAGSHEIEIYEVGTKGTKNPVLKATLVVESGQSYTVAAVNKAANLELKAFTNNTQGTADKANLRVGHFSPDAPTVNVGPKGAAPLFTNLSFKDISDYQALAPGSYDLSISATDGKEVLALPGIKVDSNKNYTVLAVNTADKLETIILQDNK